MKEFQVPKYYEENWPENHLRGLEQKMSINRRIDATRLNFDILPEEVEYLCEQAHKNHFNAIVIPPHMVKHAVSYKIKMQDDINEAFKFENRMLKSTYIHPQDEHKVSLLIKTVISFPNGWDSTMSKSMAIIDAFNNGADICDMVLNPHDRTSRVGAILEVKEILDEIASWGFNKKGIIVPIIEVEAFDGEQDPFLYDIVAGLASIPEILTIKTATGINGQTTTEDVTFISEAAFAASHYGGEKYGEQVLIKASGGIRDKATAEAMIECGASILGVSKYEDIMDVIDEEKKEEVE